jgi:hypothetical protein
MSPEGPQVYSVRVVLPHKRRGPAPASRGSVQYQERPVSQGQNLLDAAEHVRIARTVAPDTELFDERPDAGVERPARELHDGIRPLRRHAASGVTPHRLGVGPSIGKQQYRRDDRRNDTARNRSARRSRVAETLMLTWHPNS